MYKGLAQTDPPRLAMWNSVLTRSSAVAERPHALRVVENFAKLMAPFHKSRARYTHCMGLLK